MHKSLHPRDDIDRLYVSKKVGERRFAGIEDNVNTSILLFEYIEKHEGRLITAIRNDTDNNFWLSFPGLVSKFNGILTLVGYLMPKPSFEKNNSTI